MNSEADQKHLLRSYLCSFITLLFNKHEIEVQGLLLLFVDIHNTDSTGNSIGRIQDYWDLWALGASRALRALFLEQFQELQDTKQIATVWIEQVGKEESTEQEQQMH